MNCPKCGSNQPWVIDSRPTKQDGGRRRRYECPVCQTRFTTREICDAALTAQLQTSEASARLAAIKDIPTGRLIELAQAEGAGRIVIPPSAAEIAHRRAVHGR